MLAHFDKYSKQALGQFFREKRELRKVTQTQLAKVLNLSSSQHVSNVERGASNYTSDQIKRIAETLCLDMRLIEDTLIREMKASFRREWESSKKNRMKNECLTSTHLAYKQGEF